MNTATQIRKQPVKRAFIGMAGSPLAKLVKQSEQKSDHVLRIPKSPDRQDPVPFDVWIDDFGQKHGQIDLDCEFQECAFDPLLGRGANPVENNSVPSHAGALRYDDVSPIQDLGLGATTRIGTGLVEGDREIKKRRPTERSWWIFEGKLFREFLQSKYDPADTHEAEKAALILHMYYFRNREDEDIWNETSWFANVKKVKQYRQYLVKQGVERFKDLKPESTWHGRRAVWRGGRCDDPACGQCSRNEISKDYSGRDHIT